MGTSLRIVGVGGAQRGGDAHAAKKGLVDVWDALDALPVSPSSDRHRERAA
ncbi:MAG: hypothetical protein JWN10_2436, partial [Solirubrobacterales bacterium]|nr:hypothetical protein [Solirubrobacterales bacterium]